jgi:hypothetical protein
MLKFIMTFVSISALVCSLVPVHTCTHGKVEFSRTSCEAMELLGTGQSQMLAPSDTNPHVFLIQPFAPSDEFNLNVLLQSQNTTCFT